MRTNGFELYGCRSPRRSIASAARRHAHASVYSQFIRADQRGHWPWPWRRLSGSMLRIGTERPFCTWLVTHARAADTFRAAQARDSSGISARNSERANWPPLPVQAVAASAARDRPPHETGRAERRSARASRITSARWGSPGQKAPVWSSAGPITGSARYPRLAVVSLG